MMDLPCSSFPLTAAHAAGPLRRGRIFKMNRATAAHHNRQTVLYLISTMGAISQHKVAELTQLQPSTVSYILRDLKNLGLVRDGDIIPSKRAGPRETLVEICPKVAWSAGLVLDSSGHKLCLMNAAGHIVSQQTHPFQAPFTKFLDALPELLRRLADRNQLGMEKCAGLAVSVPGIVNSETGCVLRSVSLDLNHFPMAEYLGKRLSQKVIVERNTFCGVYAEKYLGCARGCDHFLYFLARPEGEGSKIQSYSFGLAIMLNGRIYRGWNSAAGELDGTLMGSKHKIHLDADAVSREKEFTAFLNHLGKSLSSLINLLDPQMMIVCGDERLLTDEHLEILNQAISSLMIPIADRKFTITRSPLGTDGILHGVALLCLHRGLESHLERFSMPSQSHRPLRRSPSPSALK